MVPYLRAANVKDGRLDLVDVNEMNFSPSEQITFALRPGDVLVSEGSGSLGSVGASAVWSQEIKGCVCFQNTLLRLRPRLDTDSRFLAWWCRYAFADGVFASIATGANIFHLSAERVKDIPTLSMPLDRQRAIADYLDSETARIDGLIGKKRRLLDLMLERRKEFCRQLILGSFNPISGQGAVPSQWRIANLGVAITLQRGHDLPLNDRIDGPVPVVSSGGTSGWHNVSVCTPPGVVTGRYGTIGEVFFIDRPYWPLNTTLYVTDFRGNDSRWTYRLLQSLPLDFDAEKSAVTGINRNVIGGLRVPLPPIAEQRRIAGVIDNVDSVIEKTRSRLAVQLALLNERRQTLITAAVTGQLDIPGLAA